jgi:hypothetical protein
MASTAVKINRRCAFLRSLLNNALLSKRRRRPCSCFSPDLLHGRRVEHSLAMDAKHHPRIGVGLAWVATRAIVEWLDRRRRYWRAKPPFGRVLYMWNARPSAWHE